MRTDAAAPTQTRNYLLAEPSLPDMFSGKAKLLYVKNENSTFGQRLKNFILKPLKIIAAKNSLLNVLRDPAFKDNEEAKKLTNHIKSLGFFEGVSTFRVKDFLVDAALHGSRLASALDTNNNAKKSLTELTGAALNEHLTHPGHMYIALQHVLDEEDTGLKEFYHFQKNSSAELNSTQIGVIKDEAQAINWYRKAAKQNHADAQFNLGLMYITGRGVEQNHGQAVQWLELAAKKGHAEAQFHLGVMCAAGQGVEKNTIKAFEWFTKAADHGHTEAQIYLAQMYLEGNGVDQDIPLAIRMFQTLAAQNHTHAYFLLGTVYASGLEVQQDYVIAANWFQMAAEQGDSNAQFNLGVMYELGNGVTQDINRAIRWYHLAAQQGHVEAMGVLRILQSDLISGKMEGA
jgi:TPR repeat protein